MMIPQSKQHEDDGDAARYQIVCCPIQLNGSYSGAETLLQLSSTETEVEDTRTKQVHFQLDDAPSLQSTSSSYSKQSINLDRLLSQLVSPDDEDDTRNKQVHFQLDRTPSLQSTTSSYSEQSISLDRVLSRLVSPNDEDDTRNTRVHFQLDRTPSLQSTTSSYSEQSVSLDGVLSRSVTSDDEDEDEEQPDFDVQRSSPQTSGVDPKALFQAFAITQSDSSAISQSGSITEKQPESAAKDSTSKSTKNGDSIAQSRASANAQRGNGSINEEQTAINMQRSSSLEATIPYGQDEEQAQKHQQKRQYRSRNKCVIIATICVCLGLCAGLVVIFLSTDPLVKQSLLRHSPTKDSDGDGLSDELEVQLDFDPMNPDTDGDGKSDGDEVVSESDPV